jgi:hypothetical protein
MRSRAYRPEVPGCLEGRSLLSGVAGLSADPVVLRFRRLNLVAEQVRLNFHSFGRDRDVPSLRGGLYDVAVIIPFGRVDGLGVSMNSIVTRMQEDLSAGVPRAMRTAQNDVLAVTRADVKARVRAGDVVIR